MENASKALIIAGAILLSILIIGLGITVYNSSSSTMGDADLTAQEVAAFNSTFEVYEGKQKGSAVRSLITAIDSNNDKKPDRQIDCDYEQNSYQTNKSYYVQFEYGDDGLISSVTIQDNPFAEETDTPDGSDETP